MGKIAFLFAGQGSQYPGMAKDFFENVKEVHDFFGVAEAIRPGTIKQLISGTEEELKKTENTQPCVFLADIASAIALQSQGIRPDAVAGFSLGEVAGLAVAGGMPKEEAFKLVCFRGKAMEQAAEKNQGSMLAVLRMDKDELEKICTETGVYPVNYNCPGQIVVSGKKARIHELKEKLSDKKVRFVEIAVGGPFHTPYMSEATQKLMELLRDRKNKIISKTIIPLYSNMSARPYPETADEMAETLSKQVSNSVKWEDTIKNMIEDGVDTFIECGPGKTLAGFVKRIDSGVKIFSVGDMAALEEVKKALA